MSNVSLAGLPDTAAALSPRATDFAESPLSRAIRQPMMLGLFLNLQDIQFSSHASSNHWSFHYNTEIVLQAEALGFELAFSRAQWLPKGGHDGDASLEAFIAMAGMAAVTRSILLVGTIHPFFGPIHPLHLAKYNASLDHMTGGRWGMNLVTGHRALDHLMFGSPRIEHDLRYEMAAELIDVLEHLWNADDNFSYQSRLSTWKMENGWITPKPLYGRPILINATGSSAGIAFAGKYSDLVFVTSPGGAQIDNALETLPAHTALVRAAAAAHGREVKILINASLTSRDSEADTKSYLEAITSHPPPAKSANPMKYDSDAHAWRGHLTAKRPSYNLGGNVELVGTPERIVDQLVQLKAAGIDGVQLNFHDFREDLAHLGASILPLMKQAGLRL